MSTDYLLWLWSLTSQAASATMIVGFFAALRRSFPTAEVRVWTQAWAANLLSLVVTFVDLYWVRSVEGPSLRAIFGLYIFGKAWFVVQMVHGLWLAGNPGAAPRRLRVPAVLIAAASVVAGLYLHDYTLLSLLSQVGIFAGFFLATLIPTANRPVGWLLRGMGLRALLSAVESLIYAAQTAPPLVTLPWTADSLAHFSAVSSSFDMLTEWLIALGCVLAATGRAHRELATTNEELHRVQASLRAMVDVDALTGLASRSALRDIVRSLHGTSAGVLFLFWLWRIMPRFGVLRPDPAQPRRSLLAHLRAIGRFLWRHHADAVLLDAVRANVKRRLVQRGLASPDATAPLAAQLARAFGMSEGDLATALSGTPASNHQYAAAMKTLYDLSHKLNEPTH